MPDIVVTLDEVGYASVQRSLRLLRASAPRYIYSAVSRTANTAKTKLGRVVASELKLKAADAKRQVFIRRKPTRASPIAGVRVSGRLIPLKRFGAVQLKRRGVVATTFRSEGRKEYAAAFINESKLGGHPFSRIRQRGNRQIGTASKRYPIHKLMGPSAADAAVKRRAETEATIADLANVLEKNMLSQIDRLIKAPVSRAAGAAA